MRDAILVALPGTSSPPAMRTLRRLDERIAQRFGGARRIWAYTSSGIRRKLALRGAPVASPAEALAELSREGADRVAVKALHLASGMEYTELRTEVESARRNFGHIALSKPLLEAGADFERAVRCLLDAMPSGASADREAVLLVAHGSLAPEAQGAYASAAALCKAMDRPVVFGMSLGSPGLADVVAACRAAGIKAVRMMPLMIVAGMSARTELGGDSPDSWKSTLEHSGIQCTPVLSGLADDDRIADLWLDDIGRMFAGMV